MNPDLRCDSLEARLLSLVKRVEVLESANRVVSPEHVERARDEAAVIAVCEMRWPDFSVSNGTDRMASVREQLRLGDEQTRRQYHAVRRAITLCAA